MSNFPPPSFFFFSFFMNESKRGEAGLNVYVIQGL